MIVLSGDEWEAAFDAALTHDLARERAAWLALTCVTCHDLALPGDFLCALCFIASAHRRDDTERAAILALPKPRYQRGFGDTVFTPGGAK